MILKRGSIADFAARVRETGKEIVIYGAGVIGQTVAPYWLGEYQLIDRVLYYVDADTHKQIKFVTLQYRQVPIRSLEALHEAADCVLLVTASAFDPIVRALEKVDCLKDTEIYFLPVMLLDIAYAPKEVATIKVSKTPLIPKKIHYCWFSGDPIPLQLQQCIDSWKRFCPDYEIVRWDERNYDISKNQYTRQAYAYQKWGYIPDYARLDILYHYGGFYLDTDVELVRNLDELLYQPAFCSTEKWGVVNMGISGAQPQNPTLHRMLDYRETISFLYPDGTENLISSGMYDTLSLMNQGLRLNGETQMLPNGTMAVYASEFFQPFDFMSGEMHLTENTFSIHHFSGTWLGKGAAQAREDTRNRYQEFLKRLTE